MDADLIPTIIIFVCLIYLNVRLWQDEKLLRKRGIKPEEPVSPYNSPLGRAALRKADVTDVWWSLCFQSTDTLDARVYRSLEDEYPAVWVNRDVEGGTYHIRAKLEDGSTKELGSGPTYSDALIAARLGESQAKGKIERKSDRPPILRDGEWKDGKFVPKKEGS